MTCGEILRLRQIKLSLLAITLKVEHSR